ncbi:MAG: DUF2520 domain-containing protein [Hespellia sp.]|nr:DUF2520 domain-containing protein [Hespellia sp.]
MRIGFIGAGKVGFTFGRYLVERNMCVSGYYSQSLRSSKEAAEFTQTRYYETLGEIVASSDSLFLTVPDHQIGKVFSDLRKMNLKDKIICHCSGVLSSGVFSGIQESGAYGYSIHPIFAVSSKLTSYQDFSNTYFTIEGDEKYLKSMTEFLKSLGNPVAVIAAEDKAKYHAAAVFASNLVIGLYKQAVGLLEQCQLGEEFSGKALLPLLQNNVENLVKYGMQDALTGPVERGDAETVRNHLSVLGREERAVYCLLSEQLLALAEQKNPKRNYGAIKQLLKEEKLV